MKLVFTRVAARQIGAIVDGIAQHSPQGALRVRQRIEAVTAVLAQHPQAGRATDVDGIRRVVVSPFSDVIFYRIADDVVVIQRVRHTSRAPVAPSDMA